MTEETFEKANALVEDIGYHKEIIGIFDKMIAHLNHNGTCGNITVSYISDSDVTTLDIRRRDFPEFIDALGKARERFKYSLRKKQEELERL